MWWDGTNYRAQTFGQTIVAPATAANEAVNLSQVANAWAPMSVWSAPSGTTAAITTATTPAAPCDGYFMVSGFVWAEGGITATAITASASGYVAVQNATNGGYGSMSTGYLPVAKGGTSTFTYTVNQTNADSFGLGILVTFQPNPGT